MKRPLSVLLLICLFAPLSALADQVTCESQHNRQAECDMDTRGEVRMVRQLSKSDCIEGETWGVNRSSVWVTEGCRAVFESDESEYSQPHGSARNRAEANRSGYGNEGGYDTSDLPSKVTCESNQNRQQDCEMNTRGEVRMVRQLSKTRCVEGENWGLSKHTIWVTDGCRAEFENVSVVASSAGNSEPTSAQIRACNAVEDRYGEVQESTPLKPGAWEIILRYDDGLYVCNVDRYNNVDYFERLRNQ